MLEEERRLAIARLRRSVREIDAQVQRIRAEERLFQRYGFGSDVHDIKLIALHAERRELLAELDRLQAPGLRRSGRSASLRSWLLVGPALVALLVQTLRPRRRRVARPALVKA